MHKSWSIKYGEREKKQPIKGACMLNRQSGKTNKIEEAE